MDKPHLDERIELDCPQCGADLGISFADLPPSGRVSCELCQAQIVLNMLRILERSDERHTYWLNEIGGAA